MAESMVMFATSSPEAAESQISTLFYDQSASEIVKEIEKCKESVAVKNKMLEEENERFQKATLVVWEMLNGSGTI